MQDLWDARPLGCKTSGMQGTTGQGKNIQISPLMHVYISHMQAEHQCFEATYNFPPGLQNISFGEVEQIRAKMVKMKLRQIGFTATFYDQPQSLFFVVVMIDAVEI